MDTELRKPNVVSWVIFFACISFPYLYLANKMGHYGDDWSYLGTMFGFSSPKPLHDLCSIDRPNLFYVYHYIGKLIGKGPLPWHLVMYGGLLILGYLTYRLVKKLRYFDADTSLAIAGIFILYPCSIMYYSAVAYSLAFVYPLCFFIASLILTIGNYKNSKVQFLLFVVSAVFTFVHEIQTEYFLGLELARVLLVYVLLKLRDDTEKPFLNMALAKKAFLVNIPNYIATFVYIIWRFFIFHSIRPETNQSKIFHLIASHPFSVIKERLPKMMNDMFLGFFGTYFNVFSEDLFIFRYKAGFMSILFIGVCIALIIWKYRKNRAAVPEDRYVQGGSYFNFMVVLALFVIGACSLLPVWFIDKHINLNQAMSRMGTAIALPGTLAFVFLLATFINKRIIKSLLWIYMAFCAAFFYRTYLVKGERSWSNIKMYFNQFAWRYPQLPVGSSFLIDGQRIPDANSSQFINFTYGYSKSPADMNYMFYIWQYEWPREDSLTLGLHFNIQPSKQIPVTYEEGTCLKFGKMNGFIPNGESESFKSYLLNANMAPDSIGSTGNPAKWPSKLAGSEVSKECFCYYFQKASFYNSTKKYQASLDLLDELLAKKTKIEMPTELSEWMPFIISSIKINGQEKTNTIFEKLLPANAIVTLKTLSGSMVKLE